MLVPVVSPNTAAVPLCSFRRPIGAAGAALPWLLLLAAAVSLPGLLPAVSTAAQEAAGPAPFFTEVTGSGFDFRHDNGREGRFRLPEITCGGAALADVDGDGDLDLYLVQGGPLEAPEGGEGEPPERPSDRLYRNDRPRDGGPLRFTDVTAEAGVTEDAYGCGVAAGDYDNDGDVDLYVTNLGSNRLLRNRGDGRFEDVTAAAGADDPRWSTSASFADYDGDGWLDLLVANYVVYDAKTEKSCRTAAGAPDYCNPAAYLGEGNRLLRNRGDGTFGDVTAAAGMGDARGKSLGVVAADLDGDGRTDFYVTNDGEPNELWLQGEDGRFRDEALFAGCAVSGRGRPEASMGVVAEDHDGDGDLDLFLTHLTGETHTLYRNDGRGGFTDATAAAGLAAPTLPATGWGVAWADLDHDGRLDLAVVNGAVRTLAALADAGDPFPFHQPDQLFRQRPDGAPGRYEEISEEAGDAWLRSASSRGLAAGDVDDDGDLDLLVVDLDRPARLLVNRRGQDLPWLGLRLAAAEDGPLGGRDLLGTRVELLAPVPAGEDGEAEGESGVGGSGVGERVVAVRRAATDGSYASARDPRVVFGLGAAGGDAPRSVRVTWPDGRTERFDGLRPRRYTVLRPGEGSGGGGSADGPAAGDGD